MYRPYKQPLDAGGAAKSFSDNIREHLLMGTGSLVNKAAHKPPAAVIASKKETSFATALATEWRAMSGWVNSVLIHALVLLLLLLFPAAARQKPPVHKITVEFADESVADEEDEPEEEVEEEVVVEAPETNVTAEIPPIDISKIEITDSIDETLEEPESEPPVVAAPVMVAFASETMGAPAVMGAGWHGGGAGGGGTFGRRSGRGRRRALRQGGGGPETENAVDLALRWLAAHQHSAGNWGISKDKKNRRVNVNVAKTSLALLAFLGAGHSTDQGKYQYVVKRGIKWLISKQTKNGCVGPHAYQSALGLMALAEAYGMSYGRGRRAVRLKRAAQKAVDWAVKSQCPAGGWDYKPRSRRNDTSVAGWWIMGLKSAKTAGLHVPYETMEKALAYLQKATAPGTYDEPSNGGVSYASTTDTLAGVTSGGSGIRLTAVALTCLQFLGQSRRDAQVVGCARALMKHLPRSRKKSRHRKQQMTQDFYLWYYETLGLFQMGARSKYWRKFNPEMKKALLATQIKTGTVKSKKGSWDHKPDTYGRMWGRVGQTALAALMLEVYYRYEDVHEKKKERRWYRRRSRLGEKERLEMTAEERESFWLLLAQFGLLPGAARLHEYSLLPALLAAGAACISSPAKLIPLAPRGVWCPAVF